MIRRWRTSSSPIQWQCNAPELASPFHPPPVPPLLFRRLRLHSRWAGWSIRIPGNNEELALQASLPRRRARLVEITTRDQSLPSLLSLSLSKRKCFLFPSPFLLLFVHSILLLDLIWFFSKHPGIFLTFILVLISKIDRSRVCSGFYMSSEFLYFSPSIVDFGFRHCFRAIPFDRGT